MPKISELAAAASLSGTDEAAFNQSGTSRRGNVSQFAAGMQADIDHTQIQNIGVNGHPAIDNHLADLSNPHVVTKTQVGLGNVEDLKVNLTAVAPPVVTNDNTEGYAVGSRWIDVTGDNEYVNVDVTTGAAVWIATTSVAKGVILVNPASNTSTARTPYPTRSAGSTAQTYFSLVIPVNYTSADTGEIHTIAGATGSGLDIDVIINYANPLTETYNANSASDTSTVYATTLDEILTIDFTALLSGVSAGDVIGVNVDHNGIGQTNYYIDLVLIYNRF